MLIGMYSETLIVENIQNLHFRHFYICLTIQITLQIIL